MTWGQGRPVIERLLDIGHLEQVLADAGLAVPTEASVLTADNVRTNLPNGREIVDMADRRMAEMTVFTR